MLQCEKLSDRSGVLREYIEEATKLVLKGLNIEEKFPELLTSRLKWEELGKISLLGNAEWPFQVVQRASKQ